MSPIARKGPAALPELIGGEIVRRGVGPIGLQIIGRITSVRHSPTLNKVVGLCWLPADMTEPPHFVREDGSYTNY